MVTEHLNPESNLDVAKRVVAKLLIQDHFVTARWVMNMSDGRLTATQSRNALRQLVKMKWMTESRVPSLGPGFTPTALGRDGFASLLDDPAPPRTAAIPPRSPRSKMTPIDRRASSISDLRKDDD